MKTKNILIIISIILLLIIGFILLNRYQTKQDNRPYKKHDFNNTVSIVNYTNYNRLDTLVYVLSEQVFKFDTMNIFLYKMPSVIKNSKMDYYAIVQKYSFGVNNYGIFLKDNLSLSEIKLILSHEFIHIEQYYDGYLEIFDDYAIFKDEKIPFTMEYRERPFEKEAYEGQSIVLKQLNNLLY